MYGSIGVEGEIIILCLGFLHEKHGTVFHSCLSELIGINTEASVIAHVYYLSSKACPSCEKLGTAEFYSIILFVFNATHRHVAFVPKAG